MADENNETQVLDKNILELSTKVFDRLTLKIDDVSHEVRTMNEFTSSDIKQLEQKQAKIEACETLEKRMGVMDDMIKLVVPSISKDELSRLGFGQKLKVIDFFTDAGGRTATPSPATVSDSTEATRTDG